MKIAMKCRPPWRHGAGGGPLGGGAGGPPGVLHAASLGGGGGWALLISPGGLGTGARRTTGGPMYLLIGSVFFFGRGVSPRCDGLPTSRGVEIVLFFPSVDFP